MYAIIAGVLVAGSMIFGTKFCRAENKPWAYPLVLSTYPMFYFGFAIYANDQAVIASEVDVDLGGARLRPDDSAVRDGKLIGAQCDF